jgi:type I restriction enzyme S subunit
MESMKNDVGMSWEMVKLDNVCTMLSGNAWSASKFKDEGIIPIIRIQNLGNNENEKFIWWNDDYDKKFVVKKGDLLLSLSGSIKIDIWKGIDALLNQRIVKLIPKNGIDPQWFYWQITNIILDIERMGKWALVNNVSITDLKDLEIPLPPLPIQKRIAEILDAADALKRKDQALLKKYDELAQAIFIDMFGDPVKNEKGWEVKKLGNLFSSPVKCGPFGSALKKEEYVNDGIPVWIMDNIQDYNFNENGCLYINEDKYLDLTSYSALKGDIIISRAGTVGKMCVLDSEFKSSIISTNLIKISLNEKVLNPYFFVKLMKYFGKKIGRLRTGSENGFTHMNTGVLAGLEFPLPTIPKQNEYINVLKNINYQIQFLGTNPENLFQTLIQKAFKGELVK